MTPQELLAAVVALCFICPPVASSAGRYEVARFEPGEVFNHLAWNKRTQQLYVGAVNRIYRLGKNLSQEEKYVTGPKLDNPNCPPLSSSDIHSKCKNERTNTDAVNKILVIDYLNERLIACFNLYHGYCEKFHLNDISQRDDIPLLPIVSNMVNGSSFAFIAQGPSKEKDLPQPEVLYVSASWSTQGLKVYRDEIPAFCSRSLNDFRLAYKGFRKSSIEIESQQRDTFPVRYIYGFGSGKFSYMLTVQKKGAQLDNYISKIFRVCQNDAKFYSYAEVELKCKHQTTHYNILQAAYVGKAGKNLAQGLGIPTVEDVLYAVFSLGEGNADTALCIYPLRDIHKMFTKNIQMCFEGIGNTGPDHIIAPARCVKANFNITDDYCGEHDINNPIDGTEPIEANAALRFGSHTNVSAIMVAVTHDYTVAFVGTTKGHLIKVTVEGQDEAAVYENITVQEGSPVNPDLRMDDKERHLFVMTEKRLTKLKVQDCQQFKTCGECLGAKDPYCGWCSLENKCSLKEECNQYEMTMRWLPYSGQQCTNITRVIPDKIQKDHSSKTQLLTLLIQNLPDFASSYECAFSYDLRFVPIITKANKTTKGNKPTGVSCQTPLPNQLPMVPTGQDHIVMRLSVRMNQQDFVSTDFTFFDCGLHNSCTSCTQSAFPCTWCIRSHECGYHFNDVCRTEETRVTGKAVPGNTVRPGPKTCPRIDILQNGHGPQILVPHNTEEEIKVRGWNLEDYQAVSGELKCNFNYKSMATVPATVKKMSNYFLITCRSVTFRYIQNVSLQNVPFNIFWGDLKALDNPSNIQVTMYKCNVMAGSCGSCLTLDEKFLCGWCQDKEHCSTKTECDTPNPDWLAHSSTCRNPLITSFMPLSGPLMGGTRLTITGENLGKKKDDLNVTIGDIKCVIENYEAPKKITCITGKVDYVQNNKVKVKIAGMYEATSVSPFRYVLPDVTDLSPTYGPVAGGTLVTIFGHHMDAGTNKQVFINTKECKVLSGLSTADYIVCETSPKMAAPSPSPDQPSPVPSTGVPMQQVIVKLDEQVINVHPRHSFTYVSDPDIISINPKHAIRSGGLRITVRGENLENVQKPRMILSYNNEEFDSPCTQKSDSLMTCYAPMVEAVNPELNNPVEVSYGFKMDGVKNVLNLTGRGEERYGVFTLYPDPIFDKFNKGVKSHQKKTEFLTINGRNLNPAIREEDVRVSIGMGACNVTSIAATQLTCRPPKSQPKAKKGNGIPEVEVIVGQNLTFTIGNLKYEEPEMLTLPTIIGIAVGASVLVFIVIIVIIAYQVKSRRSNDMMKKMRIQMDSLEARVANECKEAFAELQTDMTELTSDLYGQVSIPFWDYRTYCMKVLFPGVENHSVIKELQIGYRRNQEDVERGLQLFFHLISNKTFLLIFIRTLESSKTFQLRDRVNVASLITVALQTKMEYGTDILKTLLADLIEKSVEGKNHPKLLLRRNESVAEKMLTNWFSFLLYKFLRECAGEPLFMLYQAIKQQVSKGPVDSVTSEARYSLSEDKLIRQQIQYKPMTLNVLDMDSFTEQKQTHIVKVLDCDTISQVKEKILDAMYKNAPFSSRPAKEDLDLVLFGHPPEWLCHEKSRQLILHDEDTSSKTESDCKRLNTLNHYQVPDGAYVAIVPKQDSVYNSSIISDKSNKFEQMPFNRSPPMNRTVISPQSITVDFDNNGVKYYHLVRHHDNDPQKEGDRGSKMVTEIYLPRLLVTKGTLQQFVDDLFERIFSTAHRGSALPLAIKYMFDFLDDQALLHNIQESETVHTWKSNSLPLRFWVNVIKNPNFVFDIYKSPIVDSCLTVVGQTFMDSCSVSEHRLGKDSPSSKLLYAKDIPKYKKWVERYYQDIKMMPAISDQDMTAMLTEESRLHQGEFNTNAALMELYKYVQKYFDEIAYALDEDEFARRSKLSMKLEQVQQAMDGDAVC